MIFRELFLADLIDLIERPGKIMKEPFESDLPDAFSGFAPRQSGATTRATSEFAPGPLRGRALAMTGVASPLLEHNGFLIQSMESSVHAMHRGRMAHAEEKPAETNTNIFQNLISAFGSIGTISWNAG